MESQMENSRKFIGILLIWDSINRDPDCTKLDLLFNGVTSINNDIFRFSKSVFLFFDFLFCCGKYSLFCSIWICHFLSMFLWNTSWVTFSSKWENDDSHEAAKNLFRSRLPFVPSGSLSDSSDHVINFLIAFSTLF